MKRRDFIRNSGAGLAIGFSGLACKTGGARESSVQGINTFELEELTVDELTKAMGSGSFTSESIVNKYLARIESVDQVEGGLNSIIEINPDALEIARQLDSERAAGKLRGPLHGIPIVIKDNIDTADKMKTTAGSLALESNWAKADAGLVTKLRDAGIVILGKANLSEWANFRSTNSSSGWSGRGGQTNNPYDFSRNPCGSSSGSAAALSANLTALAIGTETNGSVVCPSSACGIVGIKPSVGLVSRSGIIPIAHSQDTAGPMGRTVRDATLLLNVMVGQDARDPSTTNSKKFEMVDYTSYLDPQGLDGARIGIVRNFLGFDDRVDDLIEAATEQMKSAGAIIIDDAKIETGREIGGSAYDVLLYEFKADIEKYLANCPPDVEVRTLADLIAFNNANADKEMPHFGQEIFIAAQEKGDLGDEDYKAALERMIRLSGPEGIDATLERHNVDVLVAATGGPAWKTDHINGDSFGGGSSSPAARAGYANITVPCGFIKGLPVGISFFAGKYSEPTILKIAYAYEQISEARRKPEMVVSG